MRLRKLAVTLLSLTLGILKAQIQDQPKSVVDYQETTEYYMCMTCINEPNRHSEIEFYCHNKVIHIKSSNYITIKIMNINLQTVIEKEIYPNSLTSIDLSSVSSGIYYLLIVSQSTKTEIKKFYLD